MSVSTEHNYNKPHNSDCVVGPHQEVHDTYKSNGDVNDNMWQLAQTSSRVKRAFNVGSQDKDMILKKSRQSPSVFTVKTSNSFDPLLDNSALMDDANLEETSRELKPPPIFIPDISDVNKMMSSIETVITKSEYTYKLLGQSKIKIFPSSAEAYRKLVRKLTELQVSFHTYQLKKDKAYRAVLKNMHHSTAVSDIKISLEEHGFKVRNISNVRHFKTKSPLPMFFIDLEPHQNNKDIFNVQVLMNAKVIFEPPHKKRKWLSAKSAKVTVIQRLIVFTRFAVSNVVKTMTPRFALSHCQHLQLVLSAGKATRLTIKGALCIKT